MKKQCSKVGMEVMDTTNQLSTPPESSNDAELEKMLGLGEASMHKNYYSLLQDKLASLEDAEQNLRIIFNNAYDALILSDFNGTILDVNQRTLEMYDCAYKEIIGRNVMEISSSEEHNPDELRQQLSRAQKGEYVVFEWSSKQLSGNVTFSAAVALRSITWRGQDVVLGTVRDITQRKRTEEVLREKEEQYRLLFENMLHGFALHEIIMDADGTPQDFRYITVNPAFERLIGIPFDVVVGKRLSEMLPWTEETMKDIFFSVALTGKSYFYEHFSEDIKKHFEVLAFCPKKGQFAVVFSDISDSVAQNHKLNEALQQLEAVNATLEKKVMERTTELEATNRKLQDKIIELEYAQAELIRAEKLASLGELVAGVAHEINTPVGVSVTAASYLEYLVRELSSSMEKRGIEADPDLQKFMSKAQDTSSIILSNLSRAANLVKSFKQVSVDRTNDLLRSFDLRGYIDEVVISITPGFKKTGLKINNKITTGIMIKSYPGAISQIITNLTTNALNHAFLGGVYGTITIEATVIDKYVRIDFSDDGVGMDREVIRKIYDPFFTTRRNSGGTGLGLFIVHNLVTTQLRGKIECTSVLGKGTKFSITIPVLAEEEKHESEN